MNKRSSIDNNSLSNLIAERIAEQILTGELQPGEKIAETSYAEEFGTSRAPIREALYLLAIEGLVERVPRKGAVVKGYTNFEMYDLLEIRMMLEDLSMRRIKEKGVIPRTVREMEKLIPFMEKFENHHRYADLNHAFHSLIVEMAESDVIIEMYSRLGLPLLTMQTMAFLDEKYILKSLKEHQMIVELLKDEQVDGADELLQQHNRDVIAKVMSAVFEQKNDSSEE